MKKSKLFSVIIALLVLVGGTGFSFQNFDIYKYFESFLNVFNGYFDDTSMDGKLRVTFVDVGQGDCSVCVLPDGKILMIDAGDNGHENEVFDFLDTIGAQKIDYLIATHPHSDHIGGMSEVISEYEIGKFYMPRVTHTSQTFKKMIENLDDKGLKINVAKAGKTVIDENGIRAEFVAPVSDEYEDYNNYSAVLKLTYENNSFLFCGDMEELSEKEVLKTGADIKADVLKVAHHGSSTSSSRQFLKKVLPEFAVISCGVDNEYNHPHREILTSMDKMKVKLYRTDKMGDITFVSDGNSIDVR